MSPSTTVELRDEEATVRFGAVLAQELRAGDVVVLEGGLGAGKTFLVRATLHARGLPEEEPVTSPTFALVHEYPAAPGELDVLAIHVDLYRIQHIDELLELGLLDQLGGEAVAFVEWGERFVDALEPVAALLRLDVVDDCARSVKLQAFSPRGEELVRAVAGRTRLW